MEESYLYNFISGTKKAWNRRFPSFLISREKVVLSADVLSFSSLYSNYTQENDTTDLVFCQSSFPILTLATSQNFFRLRTPF